MGKAIRKKKQSGNFTTAIHSTPVLVHLLIIIALLIASYSRNTIWKNEIGIWSDVVKKSPNKARGYYNLGLQYLYSGNINQALNAFLIVLTFDSDNIDAHNNLGMAYQKLGRYHDAMNEYQIAINLNPNYAAAYNNLGTIYRHLGHYHDAISKYRTALRINPYLAEAHNNIGNIYDELGYFKEAINEYQAAIKIKPEFEIARTNLEATLAKNRSQSK